MLHLLLLRSLAPTAAVRCSELMSVVSPLHPVHLTDLPEEGLAAARKHYTPEVERLIGINPGRVRE